MLPSGFPNTMDGLLAMLASGEMSLQQAADIQRQHFRAAAVELDSVIRFMDEPFVQGLPFSGVAVAHKDIFEQDGYRPGLGRDRGHADASAVIARAPAVLRAQGMVQLGTVAMAEDACSATGFTRRLPTPKNPLRKDLAVGGSSSGSAVAVASGMVFASLGTDTAGSVRIPAMTCGVMGLKTTHLMVDRTGMELISPSLDSIGVLARSVQDLGHVFRLVASKPLVQSSPDQLRVCFWDAFEELGDGDADIAAVVRAFAGHHAAETRGNLRGLFETAGHHATVVMSTEVAQTQRERIENGLACEEVRQLGLIGMVLPGQFYEQAIGQRQALQAHCLQTMFADVDIWLMPLQLQPLPTVEQVYPGASQFNAYASLAMHKMCGWINYLGLPSLAMPVGTDASGLPVSIQMVAKPGHELDLLRLARQVQDEIFGKDGIRPSMPSQEEV